MLAVIVVLLKRELVEVKGKSLGWMTSARINHDASMI